MWPIWQSDLNKKKQQQFLCQTGEEEGEENTEEMEDKTEDIDAYEDEIEDTETVKPTEVCRVDLTKYANCVMDFRWIWSDFHQNQSL